MPEKKQSEARSEFQLVTSKKSVQCSTNWAIKPSWSWSLLIIIFTLIIQQIVTLSKYGHDVLDICHP